MKKILIILFFLGLIQANAQQLNSNQLDSLYNLFVSSRTVSAQVEQPVSELQYIKCGFRLTALIQANINSFSIEQQKVLRKILERPVKNSSMVTPGGFFRIHYNSSGADIPKYFIDAAKSDSELLKMSLDSLALALDSTYNFEVNFLNYPAPPSDGSEGGDGLYDIYVDNLDGERIYGETRLESEVSPGTNKFTTYIRIENDFNNYPTKGIDGARVTAAHEFHHAIQLGDYIFRDSDIYFYELTAVSMEEFVFNTVNDYYYYLPSYFNSPNKAFAQYDGYELAIWNIFLQKKFGFEILKRQWELMVSNRAILAITNSILENGSTFGKELNEFGIWTYFTKYHSIKGKYFTEASKYPLIKPISKLDFIPPLKEVNINSSPTSNNLILFNNSNTLDTLGVIITNGDYVSGIDSISRTFPFQYILSNSSIDGGVQLDENYFSKLSTDKPIYWYSSEILNDQVLREGTIVSGKIDFAFPSPFIYGKNSFIYFPVSVNNVTKVDLNIYTPGMELVFSKTENISNHGVAGKVIRWDGRNNNKEKLSSGVYVYAIKSGDETTIGKLVIFNE